MRRVVRIGVWLSVIAVLASMLLVGSAFNDLNEWRDEPLGGGTVFMWTVLIGALYALIPLAFIWLGVFVAYVVVRAARVSR